MLLRDKIKPELVYYILSGMLTLAGALLFTILSIYYVTVVKMDPLQLVLVGTVLEGVYFLFEVPTGVVADTYSRRLSLIIGMFFMAAAYLAQWAIPIFALILLAEAVRAIGETFLSGAIEAWLADEVGEDNVGPILIRSGQIHRLVAIGGTLACVAIASWRLELPILLGALTYLALGVFLILFMSENGFKPIPQEERNNWKNMTSTFRQGVKVMRGSHVLLALVLVSAVMGISSEGYDRLWEAHLLTNFTFPALGSLQPVVWFGILSISGDLVGLAVTEANRRRLEKAIKDPIRTARLLMVLSSLTILTGLGLALAGNFALAFAVLMLRSVVFALMWPLYNTWLIQHIRPEVRATVISMMGQANSIGQVAGGPGVGAIGRFASIRAALAVSALLFAPAPALYGWLLRKEIDLDTAAPSNTIEAAEVAAD
jgi:MFS transporter, DHA3 family, tetracycline resistance protein